jgi:hypothetical protein
MVAFQFTAKNSNHWLAQTALMAATAALYR